MNIPRKLLGFLIIGLLDMVSNILTLFVVGPVIAGAFLAAVAGNFSTVQTLGILAITIPVALTVKGFLLYFFIQKVMKAR